MNWHIYLSSAGKLLTLSLPIFIVPKLSAFYVSCIKSNALRTRFIMEANNMIMNPNQTAQLGSYLFAIQATLEDRQTTIIMTGKKRVINELF